MDTEAEPSESPLDDHLKSILDKRLGQLGRALSEARRERGVEAVHDLRVASRRLRAFGVTFRDLLPEKMRSRLDRKLKRVARSVSSLRDLDVQLELLEARLALTPHELERAALEHLLENLVVQRAEAAQRADRRLGKVDVEAVSRLVRRVQRTVSTELGARDRQEYALSVLEALVGDAAEQLAPAESGEDSERLHRLRIDLKELRYALELFEPVLGSRYTVLYERAAELQEVLGAYHDLVTLAEVIGERSEVLRSRRRGVLARGLLAVAEALSAEREAVLARFLKQGFDVDAWRDTLRRADDAG